MTATTEPLLTVSDLRVTYGQLPAVRSVNLEVRAGEVVAILGINGAGKSSVLNSIAGVVRSKSGQIAFEGEEITRCAPEAVVARGLALSPEGRRIFASLTVRENLRVAAGLGSRSHFAEREAEVLSLFPVLGSKSDLPAGVLSGGEQQQLALGRALIRRPKMLLLDEPSLGLAPKLVAAVFDLLGRLRERGMTMLLVEQNVQRTLELADRGYVLDTGRIVLEGSADELEQDDLESAYLGISADQRTSDPSEGGADA
jgi:branched-chain amino acid transport system ATP-binding protein